MRHVLVVLTLGAMLALTTSAARAANAPAVFGEVTQKFTTNGDGTYLIAVGGTPYDVPGIFWLQVQVGDTVTYTGTEWRIVKTSFGPSSKSEPDRAAPRRASTPPRPCLAPAAGGSKADEIPWEVPCGPFLPSQIRRRQPEALRYGHVAAAKHADAPVHPQQAHGRTGRSGARACWPRPAERQESARGRRLVCSCVLARRVAIRPVFDSTGCEISGREADTRATRVGGTDLGNRAGVAVPVTRALGGRRRTPEAIQDPAFQDVPGRLASLLLSLARDFGEQQEDGIRLTLRLTHDDLARMLGATQATVTTLIRRFNARGLLGVERRSLLIVDRDRLRALALRAAR